MTDIAKLVRRYVDCYNSDDVEGMLECCDDEVAFETVSNPGGSVLLRGKQEMREVLLASTEAFRDRRHDLVRLVVNGETAAAETIFSGIARIEFGTDLRVGDNVSIRGATFFELEGDRIGRICDYS